METDDKKKQVNIGVAGGYGKSEKNSLALKIFAGIAILGFLLAVCGGMTALVMVGQKDSNAEKAEMLARARKAESYVPEIDKEMQEFAAKQGRDSTLNMFQETNSGKVKMEADPDYINGKKVGKNGQGGADGSGGGPGAAGGQGGMGGFQVSDGKGGGLNMNDDKAKKLANAKNAFANNKFQTQGGHYGMGAANSGSAGASGQTNASGSVDIPEGAGVDPAALMASMNGKGGKGGKTAAFTGNSNRTYRSANKTGSRGGGSMMASAKAMGSMLNTAMSESNTAAARATMDAAWEGTTADSEAEKTLDASDYIDNDNTVFPQGEERTPYNPGGGQSDPKIPDVSDFVDVTPWSTELNALQYMFMGAMAVLGIAAFISDTQVGKPIAIGMAATALAASMACLGLAITLMAKYGQNKLGGMWVGICTAGIGACAAAVAAGVAAYKGATAGLMGFLASHVKTIMILIGVVGGIGSSIGMSQGMNLVDKDKAKEYCKTHQDNSGCKIDDKYKVSSNKYVVEEILEIRLM